MSPTRQLWEQAEIVCGYNAANMSHIQRITPYCLPKTETTVLQLPLLLTQGYIGDNWGNRETHN